MNPIKLLIGIFTRIFSFSRFVILWGIGFTIATLYFIITKDDIVTITVMSVNAVFGLIGGIALTKDDSKRQDTL